MEVGTIIFIGLVSAFLIFLFKKKQQSDRGTTKSQNSEQSIYHYSQPSGASDTSRKPIVIHNTPQTPTTNGESGFVRGLFSFFKFALLIASLFAAFGGGFYVGTDIENKRINVMMQQRVDEVVREHQTVIDRMQREHQSALNQYKEQLRTTRDLLQQAQMQYRYNEYDGGY